jgi:uncharacterized membrane protein (TIGR02234 family)
MRTRVEYAATLAAELLGAVAAVVIATRVWQTVTTARPRPFRADVLPVTGRSLDAAPTACALVALAGIVAVLATRGWARRSVGIVVAVAGAALCCRSLAAAAAVGPARARALVRAQHQQVSLSSSAHPTVTVTAQWPTLSALAGALVVLAGVAVVLRGGVWAAMSARYEAPRARPAEDAEQQRARADASMWSALERGEDPTDPSG